MDTRTERDSLGEVRVPADRYWGAVTQRSLQNFPIGDTRMPLEIVHAYGVVKRAAAETNRELGLLDAALCDWIVRAADEVASGALDDHFPLVVWQTGSGTQTHMNVNEVIANRAIERAGGVVGSREPVHPNDHVNLSQSSNDTFPTAMHVALVTAVHARLLPALRGLAGTLRERARTFDGIVKVGRTHLQDATPIRLGQEVGAWARQVEHATAAVEGAVAPLHALALGGTAVGTGLNAPEGFARLAVARIARITGHPFVPADDLCEALASHDALVTLHGALAQVATAAMKVANDVRWLASGPRSGLGELALPANEPGSSIMPGKVNPTQAEALTMVCARVFGNQTTVTFAASQGNFQLNVFKPVLAATALESIGLLADALASFDARCVAGLQPVPERIQQHLDASLMLVTALNPHVGYDTAARIAKHAHAEGLTLRQAAIDLGVMDGATFDRLVVPGDMTGPLAR